MKYLVGLITFISFYLGSVNSQNTRNPTLKYAILNKTQYVNKIDLTNSGFSLYYGLGLAPNQNRIYFYFVRTPTGGANVNLEIIFGSSKQSVYSMVLTRTVTAGPVYNCNTADQFYTNGTPAPVALSTISENCALTNNNEWSDGILYSRLLAPVGGYQILTNQPMNIQFITSGGTTSTYTYTITLYNSKYCHGVCGDTSCDGPDQNDCTACKDPLRVAIHNMCVQRVPLPLPQPSGPPPQTQIWNKLEFMNDKFNASLYYGFRTEQGLDYCYFRILVNQTMTTDPLKTPSWLGFSFTDTHQTQGTTPYSDMLIIRYNAAYTATDTPIVEDYHTESAINPPNTGTPSSYPVKDIIQNYVVSQGGYDGSSKWDVTILRVCNLQVLSTLDPATATYYDQTQDLQKIVSCNQVNACTYGAGVTSYAFSLVVGNQRWDNVNIMNNLHYPKIKQVTYPSPASTKLLNQKYCPSCMNNFLDCVGPERQDCTTCNTPSQEFDPLYPSSGPGICIPKIPPCHVDCVYQQCITSFNDGCKVCSDPTKFLYLPPAGRCITSKTLFWNKVDLATTDLSFYYGWDSSFEFIYFRFVGLIKGWVGLLFYKDKSTFSTQQDTFYVANTPPLQAIDSKCSNPPDCFKAVSPQDPVQNVVVLPQTSWTTTSVDMIVSRQANTKDTNDVVIDNNYIGVTIFYDTVQTNIANSFAGTTLKTVEKPTQQFLQTQQCALNCSSCTGPEISDCLSCNTGFALAGSAPNQCVGILTTGCNAACATCQAVNVNMCITCKSIIQVVYNGNCISKYPTSWNKIYFAQANFTLYYGFDAVKTNIYFRVTGKNSGWIGFGFMDRTLATSKHLNTDMIIIRKDITNQNVLLEDRLSKTQAEPLIDTNVQGKNNLQYIQGDRDIEGYWDVYFVRACNTGDTQGLDFIIQPNIYFYLSFAYGPSDILTGHTQVFSITTIFKDTQICDGTCTSCTGPELQQCTSCQSGFVLQRSAPSYCVLQQKSCSQACSTCSGPTVSDCLQCANASYMQAGGLCVPNSPSFWNKVVITVNGLTLYYGYDTALENIYFRLKGKGPAGWLGMAFQATKEKMDMVIIRMVSGNTILDDRYTDQHNYLPYDDISLGGSKNYYLVSGGRMNTNDWDVTFMRKVSQLDPNFDMIIDQRLYTLSFAYGSSDTFDYHSSLYSVPNVRFLTSQVCDQKCFSCSGPESTDCQTCQSGQKLAGTAPNSCVDPGVTCNINCATCSGPGQSDCIKCSSADKIAYNGNCISSSPNVWNRIDVKNNFVLYYGYDAGGSYIYFRAVGTAPGWFGVGFNGSMINTDMHIVRIVTSTVDVEDRYSLGHVLPLLDLQDNLVLIKGSLVGQALDCTWVRSTISADTTYDVSLSFDVQRDIIFAFGSTQVFNKHTEVYIVKGITLVRTQVCASGCLKCTGPDMSNCTKTDTTTTTVTGKSTVDWNYSTLIKPLSLLLIFISLLA